jgi:hypothetical protein
MTGGPGYRCATVVRTVRAADDRDEIGVELNLGDGGEPVTVNAHREQVIEKLEKDRAGGVGRLGLGPPRTSPARAARSRGTLARLVPICIYRVGVDRDAPAEHVFALRVPRGCKRRVARLDRRPAIFPRFPRPEPIVQM